MACMLGTVKPEVKSRSRGRPGGRAAGSWSRRCQTPRMRLVLLGAPGSGKGTQGRVLSERLGVALLSTGEMLRAQVAAGTELGRQVAPYLDEGTLVPDELVLSVVADELAKAD